ncbi:hypothetical protein Btru_038083 [Bulinus truncatus]|nr:hypothetical protein Btru_038083 [Bulinus truncatus]
MLACKLAMSTKFVVTFEKRLCPRKFPLTYILPHGGIALDPKHFNTTNATAMKQAWEIYHSCLHVGKEIFTLNPDVIFLSTPHGISDLKNFVLYLNAKASGYADTDNCKCPPCCYSASVDIDIELSQEIIQVVGFNRNITGISAFGPPGQSDEFFPLRWGEVIPIHFLSNSTSLKVVILSHPSRRYSADVEMIPELLSLGSSIYSVLEKSTKKVSVIISADLAHTHDSHGPYGYSNTSEPFDQACGLWASTLNPDALLVTAASFVDQALSCGFTGFVMLHGILQAAGLNVWKPELLVNHHPSYYGMMVASFLRQDSPRSSGVL